MLPSHIADRFWTKEILQNQNNYFVFINDQVATTWTEWIVTHSDTTKVCAVATENFLSWDKFKNLFLNSAPKDVSNVSPALQKMFASYLFDEHINASEKGKPIFKTFSNIKTKEDAAVYINTIVKTFPQIKYWYDVAENAKKKERIKFDNQDEDFETIYESYKKFLNGEIEKFGTEKFHDVNWFCENTIEKNLKQFEKSGLHFYIFYPETFPDWQIWKEVVSQDKSRICECVSIDTSSKMTTENKTCDKTKTGKKIKLKFFENSCAEIRHVALKILELCNGKANDSVLPNIAISVCDIANVLPYLERELELYGIPYVEHVHTSLTKNSSARIFSEIKDCYDTNFSLRSVRALLGDIKIDGKYDLLDIAGREKILFNYKTDDELENDDNDIWKETFDKLIENADNADKKQKIAKQKNDFQELQKQIKNICESQSFAEVQNGWKVFNKNFLDFRNAGREIISKCEDKLSKLVYMEKSSTHKNNYMQKPFDFFVSELESSTYQRNKNKEGVHIFSYGDDAGSVYDYRFVVNANQTELTVEQEILPFIVDETKRKQLGLQKQNISELLIQLYENGFWSASENTFNGFAIPYCNFVKEKSELLKKELKKQEKQFVKHIKLSNQDSGSSQKINLNVKVDDVKKAVHINKTHDDDKTPEIGKIHIGRSDLDVFVVCKRKWLLNRVLKLEEYSLDVDMIENTDVGKIVHEVMQKFMDEYEKNNNRLPIFYEEKFTDGKVEIKIETAVKAVLDEMFKTKPLVRKTLESHEATFKEYIMKFLKFLLKSQGSGGIGGAEVVAVEEKIPAPINESLAEENACYYGTIDLVVKGNKDNHIIIDYKNTASSVPNIKDCADEDIGKIKNFQMLTYAKLWNNKPNKNNNTQDYDEHKEVKKCVFYAVKDCKSTVIYNQTGDGDGSKNQGNSKPLPDRNFDFEKSLESIDEISKKIIEMVEKAIENKTDDQEVEVEKYFPMEDMKGEKVKPYIACVDCDYKAVCRKIEV